MICKAIVLVPLTCLLLTGCNDGKDRKNLNKLSEEIKTLKSQVEKLQFQYKIISEKDLPASLHPTDSGYDFAVDSDGVIYPISIENVSSFPGGVKYVFGVTNIYSVGLNRVELEFCLPNQTKKVDIPQIIQPGKQISIPVSFNLDDGKFPTEIYVNAKSKAIRFIKQ